MLKQVYLLIIVSVCSLASCVSIPPGRAGTTASPLPESQPTATSNAPEHALQISFDESKTIEHTVREGIDLWLGSYLGTETPPAYRLRDYRIKKVESIDDQGVSEAYDYVFLLEYDLLPRFEPSDWIAGDGRYGRDGWIVGKIEHLGIVLSEGTVYIMRLGACPTC